METNTKIPVYSTIIKETSQSHDTRKSLFIDIQKELRVSHW